MLCQGVTQDTGPYFMERFSDFYAAEIRDFLAGILEDCPPSATGQDAHQAPAISIAATL